VLANLPGFLAQFGWIDPSRISPFLVGVYANARCVVFAIAFVAYLFLCKLVPNR
jgi:hypothetical protein